MKDGTRFITLERNRDFIEIEEHFAENNIISWQIYSDDSTGNARIAIEFIPSDTVEITEDLCLICMTNKTDGDCAIRLAWKGGEEERVVSFTCTPCFDVLQNNHINIKQSAQRTGLSAFL